MDIQLQYLKKIKNLFIAVSIKNNQKLALHVLTYCFMRVPDLNKNVFFHGSFPLNNSY